MRAALALLLSGCPGETRCFVGDPSLPAVIEAVYRDSAATMQPLEQGDRVPLILPPQGGKVMFIGVRATNLDGCPITISTSIRDVCSNAIIALERRPVTLEPTGDGWLEPLQPSELSNYSNLPACPRANLERDVHGEAYQLSIRVEDKDGRKAEAMLDIVPFCSEPEFEDQCLCECDADYAQAAECMPENMIGTSSCGADLDGGIPDA